MYSWNTLLFDYCLFVHLKPTMYVFKGNIWLHQPYLIVTDMKASSHTHRQTHKCSQIKTATRGKGELVTIVKKKKRGWLPSCDTQLQHIFETQPHFRLVINTWFKNRKRNLFGLLSILRKITSATCFLFPPQSKLCTPSKTFNKKSHYFPYGFQIFIALCLIAC